MDHAIFMPLASRQFLDKIMCWFIVSKTSYEAGGSIFMAMRKRKFLIKGAEKPRPVSMSAGAVASVTPSSSRNLLREMRELIVSSRGHVAQAVDAGLTMLYWKVGACIRREILGEKRAK